MNKSNKLLLILSTVLIITFACDDALKVENPNEPTPAVLETEEGLTRQAPGIYNAMGGGWFEWIVWFYHESMGDAFVVPWGNYN